MTKILKATKILFFVLTAIIILATVFLYLNKEEKIKKIEEPIITKPVIPVYIGPRQNIPDNSPDKGKGFWSFAVAVDNILSRSGQPTYENFKWLKENGWRGVIDTREDGEYGEVTDDKKIPGFNEIGFNYLYIPMKDNTAPTDEQAKSFLNFITDPKNQPAHLHCMAGIGRTGTLTALYRYSVQGWPLEDAVKESRLFNGGLNTVQKAWIEQWAQNHQPGEYRK